MPVVAFATGPQTGSTDVQSRSLVPGIEPGGERVGRAKPALLLVDCFAWMNDVVDAGTTADHQANVVSLKLSQEPDLNPGLLLNIASWQGEKTATANLWNATETQQHFAFHAGTLWAPAYVGIRVGAVQGGVDTVDWNVFLRYEQVEVEWMDWFIMWDFLDNVIDNSSNY